MSRLHRAVPAVLLLAFATTVAAGAWWLVMTRSTSGKSEKPPPAASVTKVVKEEEFNTVRLTEEAERRLGLKLTALENKTVRRVRLYGGEVTIPVGRTILVAAPLGGTLVAPTGGVPKAGQAVKAGQPVFQLTPLLTPDGRATLSASLADVEGQVNNARTQSELARIALERAKRVHKEGAGSQRQVDEAQAAFDVAAKTLTATMSRLTILKSVVGDAEAGTVASIPIDTPEDGILRVISALPGQTVPSGAALFEVIDLSTVWVRVPLPVGDLDAIDRSQPAEVGKLSAAAGNRLTPAKPVAAPPSANALSATVDVFYEMPNSDTKLTPGQRLGVTIPLMNSKESLTVPWSALVFDIHGGTWVYAEIGPRTFERRRVIVRYTAGPNAVLASGPRVGTKVVVDGAQELFGAETGFIK